MHLALWAAMLAVASRSGRIYQCENELGLPPAGVKLGSLRLGFQRPLMLWRWADGLGSWLCMWRFASATASGIHVPVCCGGSAAVLASLSHASFFATPQWSSTNCSRMRPVRPRASNSKSHSVRKIGPVTVSGPVWSAMGGGKGSVKKKALQSRVLRREMVSNNFFRPTFDATDSVG
ncbi:hypothetical protein DQ04_12231030 [Trypanosoma grayi]|uniref:hypothetical protein n=1 Tax=Trypanosoma grayi TaxID=71804 RepID=UPI0004F455DA|nr:hypothetical protein DQ04_12231030 [Trypanosoma grayi]KEG06793.1 hypothetical protein DQ04_12231030 [Trypanosoma grayi]